MCCKSVDKQDVRTWMARIGRSLFSISVLIQAFMFARYPSIYRKNEDLNSLCLLAIPSVVAAVVVIFRKSEREVKWLWLVWLLYVLFLLTPMVAYIFGWLRQDLDTNIFFGPNILKMIICGSPVIAVLLFVSAKDARQNGELIVQLCGGIALDLFDDIEVLEVLLPHKESSLVHLPKSLEISIIVCVCSSLLLSPLEIAENKLIEYGQYKPRKKLYLCRLILQMLLVNLALLIIRMIVWLQYEHDASIFITKNFLVIVIAIINIARLRCGFDEPA